jgi:hypothetical protein
MNRRISFLLCLLFPTVLIGQFGCTDPLAQNYNASATQNDGSCTYGATNISYPLVDSLANELPESSGLEFWDQLLWSHNDSDNSSRFYGFDTLTGLISRSVLIENSPQIDWEDMTKDESHFYIGDFGNNAGTRTNLKILKIPFDSLTGNALDTVQAEFIQFSYPDQTDFSGVNANHNFDCEAFVFFDDSLHLFSKNRSNGYTKHYVLPTTPGTYVATFIDSVFVDGQITSAAFSSDSILFLIGYKPPAYSPFAFLAWDYQQTDLFSGNKRRLQLGSVLTMGQQEGVCFSSGKKGFISSEQVTALNQVSRYFSFDLSSLIVSTVGMNEDESHTWIIYPNPFQETIFIEGVKLDELDEIRFVNALGVSLHFTLNQLDDETIELNTEQLSNGCYFLSFVTRGELVYIKVLKE